MECEMVRQADDQGRLGDMKCNVLEMIVTNMTCNYHDLQLIYAILDALLLDECIYLNVHVCMMY